MSDDTISRQAAIDAILAVTGNSSVRELYEHVQEHGLSDMWSGGVNAAIDIIIAVPSAQPELCEGAVSRRRLLSDLKELIAAWEKYPVMAEQIKGVEAAIGYVESIPSAQPKKRTKNARKRTACDSISRQAAIECNGFREVERNDERRSN